ncbi:glycosyltransferase [Siccirubricoccus sp. KC 17139]|uniref:Glycosyltransferase n=1 Tax=Siccirubricoccus soli TaxID=2899147 RepID=A0ABT1DAZ3_9PROT|nr:glycosyltransferase [Siccirubricoccus soli]MCO6418405.1 glycosyltransferase [Siccirubricoccus soli]MCP2684540.1 glycosyltransferase [Siccirubricoccus soli]
MIDTAPRRVLMVNRVAHMGGVERVIVTLAAGLRPHGWDVLLACPPEGELPRAVTAAGGTVLPCDFDRMKVTRDPMSLLRYPFAWRAGAAAVERHARAAEVSLLHTHHPVGTLYAMRAARRLNLPLVQHMHEVLPVHLPYALTQRLAATACDRFLCVSGAGQALLAHLGIAAERCETVHNGVDPGFLARGPATPAADILAAGPGPHIGVFGVIEPRKGQDVFLAAAARLAAQHPQARFWIVGGLALADHAPFLARLKALSGSPELAGRVGFTGHRPDVAACLAAMDVVVQASVRHDSLSMALIEALTLGRRIVATDVGGTAEIVTHGRTGLLVPPANAAALAEAMAEALGPRGAGFGQAAARDAARFRPEAFCAAVARSFDAVLAARHAGAGRAAPVAAPAPAQGMPR